MLPNQLRLIPDCCYCIVKRSHINCRRFVKPMRLQQDQFMQKFNAKFEKTFQKMLKPKNVRTNSATPYSSILETEEGVHSVLKQRQNVINKIFLQTITSVMAEQDIGSKFRQMKAAITQVDVTRSYRNVMIFYYCHPDSVSEVADELLSIKTQLIKTLINLNLMGFIPNLEFVYDRASRIHEDVYRRLDTADFGPDHPKRDLNEYARPQPAPPDKPKRPWVAKHKWDLTNFDKMFAASRDENPYEKPEEVFEIKFICPTDMRLDLMGLDYNAVIRKVLFEMKRVRREANPIDPIDHPLPPGQWHQPIPVPIQPRNPASPEYQYENRIAMMKKFLVENRKKKLILAREARKVKYEADVDETRRLEEARERIELKYTADYDLDEKLGTTDEAYDEFLENLYANEKEENNSEANH